jgi:hypothetical protein
MQASDLFVNPRHEHPIEVSIFVVRAEYVRVLSRRATLRFCMVGWPVPAMPSDGHGAATSSSGVCGAGCVSCIVRQVLMKIYTSTTL